MPRLSSNWKVRSTPVAPFGLLRCDFLHDIIGRKCGNEAYTRRIAREQFVREGIDLVIRNWHAHQSITVQKPLTGRLVGNSYLGITSGSPVNRPHGREIRTHIRWSAWTMFKYGPFKHPISTNWRVFARPSGPSLLPRNTPKNSACYSEAKLL